MMPPEVGHGFGAQNVGLLWGHSMPVLSGSTPLWLVFYVFPIVEADRRMKSGIEFLLA
jgi:hypothetical protein